MVTPRSPRLFRFLLSLVVRLRLSAGRITLALRSWSASLWTSILTFSRRRGQSRIRFHANDDPVVDDNPMGEHPQISERAREEEHSGTLAALPVRRPVRWQDEVARYQALTSSKFDTRPAVPEGVSQRYNAGTTM
jgi:hypothetical protein